MVLWVNDSSQLDENRGELGGRCCTHKYIISLKLHKFCGLILPTHNSCPGHSCNQVHDCLLVNRSEMINRPGVAGAVLQSALSLMNSVTESAFSS